MHSIYPVFYQGIDHLSDISSLRAKIHTVTCHRRVSLLFACVVFSFYLRYMHARVSEKREKSPLHEFVYSYPHKSLTAAGG